MNFNNISKKISLKKKIIIISVLFPLAIGGLILLVIVPTVKDIKNIKNEIEAQRIDLEIKYKKGQSINKLTKDLEVIEPQLLKLNRILIGKDKVLEFITELEEVASSQGVEQKINLAAPKNTAKDGYKKTPLQIITNGNFIKQLNYLINLEAMNYYININSLELKAGYSRPISHEGQTPERPISMLIFADTYWE